MLNASEGKAEVFPDISLSNRVGGKLCAAAAAAICRFFDLLVLTATLESEDQKRWKHY